MAPRRCAALVHYLCSHDQQHLAGLQWLLGKNPGPLLVISSLAELCRRWAWALAFAAGAAGGCRRVLAGAWDSDPLGPVRTGMTVEQVLSTCRLARDGTQATRRGVLVPAITAGRREFRSDGHQVSVVVRIEIKGVVDVAHVRRRACRPAPKPSWPDNVRPAPRCPAAQVRRPTDTR